MIEAATNLMVGHVIFGVGGRIPGLIPVIPSAPNGCLKQLLWAIKSFSAGNFASKYQDVGNLRLSIAQFGALHCGGAIYLSFGLALRSAKLGLLQHAGRHDVDLALKLDVLAVCAVFAFVGAILLGAF